ncbi:MAG TPA: rhodanese-like domain-containing protein [Thermoanaerobaculia bacterium]|nr:rhodanese-like domain-containing protein [Thermoanaerobaculia bacterium]
MPRHLFVSCGLVLLAVGCGFAHPAAGQEEPDPEPVIERLSPAAAKAAVDAGEAVLLDVRHVDAYRRRHAAGALHLAADQLPLRWRELPRDRRLILYCS